MGSGIQDRIERDHGLPGDRHYGSLVPESKPMNQEQPKPTKNDNPAVWSLVMKDMVERDILGAERYGVRLQANNGRDTLLDAYQEALDLAVYLRAALYERDGK